MTITPGTRVTAEVVSTRPRDVTMDVAQSWDHGTGTDGRKRTVLCDDTTPGNGPGAGPVVVYTDTIRTT